MFQAIDVHGDYNFLESSERVLPAVKFHLRPSGNRPRDSFPFVITFIDPVTGGVTSYHVMDPFAHVFRLILCIALLFLFTRKTIVTRRFDNTQKNCISPTKKKRNKKTDKAWSSRLNKKYSVKQ